MNSRIDAWTDDIREVLQNPVGPLSLKNGLWQVNDRESLFHTLGPRISDSDLDRLKASAAEVLRERDPKFDLPPQERFAAAIYGKQMEFSYELRRGLAESLALIATQPQALENCSTHKAEDTATGAVREILQDDDGILWGSLNDVLPILAEASPREFMTAIERGLQNPQGPFDELFAQESSGITSGTYISGLLWALETLAWDEDLLVRVCVILAKLAERDPGGNWVNRPANSLATILLPWLPQTRASFEKQTVAIRTLRAEVPDIAWKTLLRLLPNETVTSSPTPKPSWRNRVPDDWRQVITNQEYWRQISTYANLVVEMAIQDAEKLEELISHLENLPKIAIDHVLDHLAAIDMSEAPEELYYGVWRKLTILIQKHKDLSDAVWAFSTEEIARIEAIADKFAPQDPRMLHRLLFTANPGVDMYTEDISRRQQEAVTRIWSEGGITAVIDFARDVDFQYEVGSALAPIEEIDENVLALLLSAENTKLGQFMRGYVWRRHQMIGWNWVDGLDMSNWSASCIGQLLNYLPFRAETWSRASGWLVDNEGEYWCNNSLKPFVEDEEMDIAVGKLLEYGRPRTAVRCLSEMGRRGLNLDMQQCVAALLDAAASPESFQTQDSYYAVSLIKTLQDDTTIDHAILSSIEWAYLPLLDGRQGVSPRTLSRQLASSPELFCEVIRTLYRSSNGESSKAKT